MDFTFYPIFLAKDYIATVIYIEIIYLPFVLEFAVVSPCIGCFPVHKKRKKVSFFPAFKRSKLIKKMPVKLRLENEYSPVNVPSTVLKSTMFKVAGV